MVDITNGSSIDATWLHTVISGRPASRASAAAMCSAPSTCVLFARVMKALLP
jgi:hypothetical protein